MKLDLPRPRPWHGQHFVTFSLLGLEALEAVFIGGLQVLSTGS